MGRGSKNNRTDVAARPTLVVRAFPASGVLSNSSQGSVPIGVAQNGRI